jgi:hypothetical protein
MLPPLAPPPEPLRRLLINNEADAKDFRQRIRAYNNALAFTSVGANLDTNVAQPGNYTYRLRGEFYHKMGSLLPQPGEVPKFAQLYISNPHAELDGRMGNFGGLNRDTMQCCKRCCMNVTLTLTSTKRPWNNSKAGLLS